MSSPDLPSFAKLAQTVCNAPGLFVSRSKGAPDQLMKLSYSVGGLCFRFVGPQLGPGELRVLQGLVGLSGKPNFARASSPEEMCLDKVHLMLSRSARVGTTYNQLAQTIGYPSDSGSAHAAIRKALERLFAVAVFVSREDDPGAKDMTARHLFTKLNSKETGNTVNVELSPILASAVLGGHGEYLRVNLEEVRQLKSDPARLLHHRLHWINAGQKPRKVLLDTLVEYVWPEKASASTHRKRCERVREALTELEGLGWSVVKEGKGYIIGRPAGSFTRGRASPAV
ncbi:MAG TPA: replication protein C, IncQ-type [Burkholderiaceae bacterium]|nr:replication protein C, IncQ-type [Burkholderiaceae bacterium]